MVVTPITHQRREAEPVCTMVRKYLCSTCLVQHAPPTGRNCPSAKNKPSLPDIDENEELSSAFNSPSAKLVDKFLSLSPSRNMEPGEGEGLDGGGAGSNIGSGAANTEILQIVRIQQEQMRVLHSTMAKMNKNITSLSGKVRKVKSGVPDIPSETDTDSSDSSGNDDRRPSLDSPTVNVPEFRSESKRHKFSLKRFMPRNVKKLVTFAGLVSALLALILAVQTAGHSVTGMLEHLRFVSDKAASKSYVTESLITYDEEIRNLAESEGLAAFSYGNQGLINKHLGVEATVAHNKKAKPKGQYSGYASSNNTQGSESKENSICWFWNHKICTNRFCRRLHICYVCHGTNHSQKDCKQRKSPEPSSQY